MTRPLRRPRFPYYYGALKSQYQHHSSYNPQTRPWGTAAVGKYLSRAREKAPKNELLDPPAPFQSSTAIQLYIMYTTSGSMTQTQLSHQTNDGLGTFWTPKTTCPSNPTNSHAPARRNYYPRNALHPPFQRVARTRHGCTHRHRCFIMVRVTHQHAYLASYSLC